MGCFLACFGTSKSSNGKANGKRRKQRHKVQPSKDQLQSNASYNPVQSSVSLVQECPEKPISPVTKIRDKPVEQLNSPTRKKVTFDSNVKTYEHILPDASTDFSPETEEGAKKEREIEKNLANPSNSQSSGDDSSITSSSASYPPNHRYQNCRDSDDELDYEESDIDDVDNEDDDGELDYDDLDEDYDDRILESRTRNWGGKAIDEEVDRSSVMTGLPEEEVKPTGSTTRDRSCYVHSVLNPVENLTQWKAVKAKGTQQLKQQKENFELEREPPRISFSSEPSFKEMPFSFKSKFEHQPKKSSQEIAVDASLSNWLSSTESTPATKTSTFCFSATTPDQSISHGSTSPRSFEDRPILGALTMEELKQLSASSSPRKSPSRSPDEMPIIGTVGTYWNHTGPAKDSGSATSFKGIPNTTSKYREDKKVNWHSTPFETRLERALNRGAA